MTRIRALAILFAMNLLAAACYGLNQQEKKIAGKYSFAQSVDVDSPYEQAEAKMTVEGVREWRRDNTSRMEATMKGEVTVNLGGYSNRITIEYGVKVRGRWEVADNYLTDRADVDSLSLEFGKASAERADAMSDMIISFIRQYFEENLVPQFRERLTEAEPSEIVSQTDDRITLDSNGEEIVYTRI